MRSRYEDPQTGGYANLTRNFDRKVYTLDLLFVPPEHRGSGAGKRILDNACQDADTSNITLKLIVGPDSDSPLDYWDLVAFYERRGFKLKQGSSYYYREPKWALPVYAAKSYEHEPLPLSLA